MTGPVRGVFFAIVDTLVDVRTATMRGCSFMSEPDLAHLYPEWLTGIAAGFADDGAYARERYMAGGLALMEQRAVRMPRAYSSAGLTASSE